MKAFENLKPNIFFRVDVLILQLVLIAILWFNIFSLVNHHHWAYFAQEVVLLIAGVYSFQIASKSKILFLKLGLNLFLIALVMQMCNEVTHPEIFVLNAVIVILFGIGILMIIMGIKYLITYGDENLNLWTKTSIALKESEEKYKDILDSLMDVYYLLDEDLSFKAISPSVKEIGGYEPEEMIGKKASNFYYDYKEQDQLKKILKDKGYVKDFELRLINKDGNPVTVSANVRVLFGENNEVIGHEGILHDITTRKKIEEDLQNLNANLETEVLQRSSELVASKENFSNVFNNTSDALIILDKNDCILDLNQSAEILFGFTKDELRTNPDIRLEYFEEDERENADALKTLALDSVPQTAEWKGKKKDGTVFDEEILLNRTDYNKQRVLLLTVRDITERKALEAKASKRLKDLQKFHKVLVGREIRMAELKKEIKKLKGE